MNDWTISQVILCSLLVIEGLALAWWYRRTVVRPARLEAAQYKFFALRDKAIRCAIDNPALKEDPNWQFLYEMANESAKQRNVDWLMRTSIPKLLAGMQKAGIPIRISSPFETLPGKPINIDDLPPMQSLIIGGLIAVLETCYTTRWLLRVKHWLARFDRLRKFFADSKDGYGGWLRLLSSVATQATSPNLGSRRFRSVIEREAATQSRQASTVTA